MGPPLLLADALLPTGERADVLVENDRIARIGSSGSDPADTAVEPLQGALLLPALVEGHMHLDKTLLGAGWIPHLEGGTVPERIEAEKALRRGLTVGVSERGRQLAERAITFGTTRMRCHVDVDNEIGLTGVEALLELREALRDRLEIQLVAFPQSGILASPGTAELMEAALQSGVEVVGGLDPEGIDGDVAGHLDVVFGLAERHEAHVDIHLHDHGEPGALELREIAGRTQATGLGGRVTVSHAYALGEISDTVLAETAAALAEAGVAIMTTAPGASAMPPVKRLVNEGVLVFTGNDNVRDAWSPLGSGDMLERAAIVAYRQGLATDPDLELAFSLATERAAVALGLDSGYGLREGRAADLVAVRASGVPEAVAAHPARELVLKGGRPVARNGRLV